MSRIALAFHGDSRRRSAWSGTPRSLADALEGIGVAVQHVSAKPAWTALALRRMLSQGGVDEAELAGATLARRLRRAGRLDGVLQIGTDFVPPATAALATFEDMTVVQARRLDHPILRRQPDREIDAWIERQRECYARATACCATTSWAAESIVRDYGVPPERVRVVGLGRNLDPRPVARDWSRPSFLFVGQDWERKNGAAVVEAFRSVRERVPEARLTILGGRPRVEAAGVHVHVPLYLNRPDERRRMERLYEEATCLVLPSRIEPSAISHLEAAAAGVPSIGTTVGGVRDLIGDAGRLVEPGDREALGAAMLELADGDTARRLGELARERSSWFTWARTAERVAAALGLPEGSESG